MKVHTEYNDNIIVLCIQCLHIAKKHDIYIHSLHTIKSTILGDILGAILGLTLVNYLIPLIIVYHLITWDSFLQYSLSSWSAC
jgi:hypothetical protein